MAASFPTSLKSFTTKTDDVDDVLASHVNDMQDEIVAIETALGAGLSTSVRQIVYAKSSAVATGTGIYSVDDTVPTTASHGTALTALNLTITPKSSSSILKFSGVVFLANGTSAVTHVSVSLHQDSTAAAIHVWHASKAGGNENDQIIPVPLDWYMAAGTTSSTTFKLYFGGNSASTTTVNGFNSARKGGGVLYSSFFVQELKA